MQIRCTYSEYIEYSGYIAYSGYSAFSGWPLLFRYFAILSLLLPVENGQISALKNIWQICLEFRDSNIGFDQIKRHRGRGWQSFKPDFQIARQKLSKIKAQLNFSYLLFDMQLPRLENLNCLLARWIWNLLLILHFGNDI